MNPFIIRELRTLILRYRTNTMIYYMLQSWQHRHRKRFDRICRELLYCDFINDHLGDSRCNLKPSDCVGRRLPHPVGESEFRCMYCMHPVAKWQYNSVHACGYCYSALSSTTNDEEYLELEKKLSSNNYCRFCWEKLLPEEIMGVLRGSDQSKYFGWDSHLWHKECYIT